MSDLWYKNAIIYAVDVDRFKDSDGNGIGDFGGLIEKLPYLFELGVTCLWVLPFYRAPDRDNGYDIKDYYEVDPLLGNLDDFITFLHKANEFGMRVILDLVVNHTSNQHPWFRAACQDPDSRYNDYYIWSDTPPPIHPEEGTIFPGQEHSVWSYNESAGSYYYHRFYHFQPELDATNPEVLEEIKRVMDFWFAFDVSGFRLDAASHLVSMTGLEMNPKGDPHAILRELRTFAQSRRPDSVLVGEADVKPENLARFFGDNDQLNMLFNFALNNYVYLGLAREEAEPIRRAIEQLPAIPQECQWANFLRNLDELDLERLTDEQRDDVFKRFAPEENMRIFGRGIRRRLAPMLQGDRRRMEMAYSLLFSLPGTPTIVYGDEIGMGEDLCRHGRFAVRSPMQWANETNAGFSDAPEDELVQPVISSGPFRYEEVNVADQQDDPDSFFHWMRKLIRMRRSCPEIGYGSMSLTETEVESVLIKRSAWKNNLVVTVHNLSESEQTVRLDLDDQMGRRMDNLLEDEPARLIDTSYPEIELEPYGYRWYRIKGES